MYNQETKMRWLGTIDDQTNKFRYRVFDQTSYFEETLEKDCSNFTANEILSFYKSLVSNSLETLLSINSQLKKYTSWCLTEKIVKDKQNHYAEMNNEILNTCVNVALKKTAIVNRSQMMEMVHKLLNPSDQFIVLGIYEGISGQAFSGLFDLTKENFNGNTIILQNGEKYEVSSDLINIGLNAIDEFDYNLYITDNDCRRDKSKFVEGDNRVLKNQNVSKDEIVSEDILIARRRHRIGVTLQKFRNYFGDPRYSASTLLESGRLERINKLIDQGIPFNQAIRDKDIERRYGKILSMKRYLIKYGDYVNKIEA